MRSTKLRTAKSVYSHLITGIGSRT